MKKTILLFWMVALVCFVSAYTAPVYTSVNFTLSESYSSPVYTSVNFTLGAVVDEDTCTAPASGNWDVNCSDYCNWTVSQSVPGNITITDSGTLTLSKPFNFTGTNQEVSVLSGCELVIESGGSLE